MAFALLAGMASGSGDSVLAGVIKWTDDQGKTHFTNDISKIPRKYRDQGKMKSVRTSGTKRASSPGGGGSSEEKADDGILSEEDIGKIQQATNFLKKEMTFARIEDTSFHTPTGLRAFGKKFTALNAERQKTKNALEGTRVPAIKKVVAHIDATLKAADENPNWMRKLSAANTIKRVKSEVSGNPGLINALEEAIKESAENEKKKKEKEEEEKKADKGGQDKKINKSAAK